MVVGDEVENYSQHQKIIIYLLMINTFENEHN